MMIIINQSSVWLKHNSNQFEKFSFVDDAQGYIASFHCSSPCFVLLLPVIGSKKTLNVLNQSDLTIQLLGHVSV